MPTLGWAEPVERRSTVCGWRLTPNPLAGYDHLPKESCHAFTAMAQNHTHTRPAGDRSAAVRRLEDRSCLYGVTARMTANRTLHLHLLHRSAHNDTSRPK